MCPTDLICFVKKWHPWGVNNSIYPGENCVYEWKTRIVVASARSILQAKEVANQFGAEVVAASIHLLNVSLSKDFMNKTPYEDFHYRKPNVCHLEDF